MRSYAKFDEKNRRILQNFDLSAGPKSRERLKIRANWHAFLKKKQSYAILDEPFR